MKHRSVQRRVTCARCALSSRVLTPPPYSFFTQPHPRMLARPGRLARRSTRDGALYQRPRWPCSGQRAGLSEPRADDWDREPRPTPVRGGLGPRGRRFGRWGGSGVRVHCRWPRRGLMGDWQPCGPLERLCGRRKRLVSGSARAHPRLCVAEAPASSGSWGLGGRAGSDPGHGSERSAAGAALAAHRSGAAGEDG